MMPSTHEPVPPFAPGDLLFWRYRYGRAIPADVAAFMADRAGGAEQYTRPAPQHCEGHYTTGAWEDGNSSRRYAFQVWQCDACGAIAPGACKAGRWKERA